MTTAAIDVYPLADLSRAEVEDFLYEEAALLDSWKLREWLELFAPGATYEVPPAGADNGVQSAVSLFYIADDYERLCFRVERLMSKDAHAEYPRSHCHRMISNVRPLGRAGHGLIVRSSFITHRSKFDVTDSYFGHHQYVLEKGDAGFKIGAKRSELSMSSLRPQGRVSIIV